MKRAFFFSCFLLLACCAFSEAGPLRNLLNRIHENRTTRRGSCAIQYQQIPEDATPIPYRSRPECPTCPIQFSPLQECKTESIPVVPQPWLLSGETLGTLAQDIVLEPRPGTGLPSRPGILTPKPGPESLLNPRVSIDLGQHLPTQQQLLFAATRADTFLSWLQVFLVVSGVATVLPWAAPAVSGLHRLLGAVSLPPAQTPSGQLAVSQAGNQAAASST